MKNLKKTLKLQEARQKALGIVKYQNFKPSIALKKMTCKIGHAAFEAGVVYLKRGKITAPLSEIVKKEIDKLKEECVQPLRPSKEEQRRFMKPLYEGKDACPPVNLMKETKKKLTTLIEYGVEMEDCIKLCKSEEEARAFCKGVLFAGKEAFLVTVEINKVI